MKIPPPPLARSAVTAFLLFVVDAFVLNQGILALVILLVVLPFILVRALFALKNRPLLKQRFLSVFIYAFAAVLIMGSINANNATAKKRAITITAACEEYRLKHGVYPQALSDLVPVFLKRIPRAKYAVSNSRFEYRAGQDGHTLMYTSMPPFGREYYVLEEKQWRHLD